MALKNNFHLIYTSSLVEQVWKRLVNDFLYKAYAAWKE
jgi:hypothetical protein